MRNLILVPVAFATALISTPVLAGPCKGLDEKQCQSLQVFKDIPACRWVREAQRADGGTVKAHCTSSGKKVPEGAQKVK